MPLKTIDKQRINPTAAPDAMKGSGVANVVHAAPVKAEERILKYGASVSDMKDSINLSNRLARHRTGR